MPISPGDLPQGLECASTLAQDADIRLGVFESLEAAVATCADSELKRIWQEAFS